MPSTAPSGSGGLRRAGPAAGVGVEALGLAAVEAAGLLGGEAEHGDGAADLAAGPLDRLAVLGGDQLGDLLGALDELPADVVEGGGADVGGSGGASSRTAYAAATASSTWASVARRSP